MDCFADATGPGRLPFVPRGELGKVVGDPKWFTAYEFVERIEKRTGVKYSTPHARRLLRSLGFSVKRVHKIADRVPLRRVLKIWQKDIEMEVKAHKSDGFALVMAAIATKTRTSSAAEQSTCAAMPNRCRSCSTAEGRPSTAA